MNKRLEEIYQQIIPGLGVIDVGTDHGYLPARLAQDGYAGRIFAADIKSGPLDAARRTARKAGVDDRIEFLLCDGLDGCPHDAVDTIVIAGMGGDTICGILDRAEWCMTPDYRLILQPMTKAEVLRYWLINNGYVITVEKLVKESGALYQVIVAEFSQNSRLSDAELFTGSYELLKDAPFFDECLALHCKRFQTGIEGLQRTVGVESTLRLRQEILKQLETMRGRLYDEGS